MWQIPPNLSALLLSNEKICDKTQISQLVIQYNGKFVKVSYLGDLLYEGKCINMMWITVFIWKPNTVHSNIK